MTLKEIVEITEPNRINKEIEGGVIGCPTDYEYTYLNVQNKDDYCCTDCDKCWNTEYKESNRWILLEEIKLLYTPTIERHIKAIESSDNHWSCNLDLSNSELNPYTLGLLLEELGYEKEDQDDNGWQLDFWITYSKQGAENLLIYGTGIVCEFGLRGEDD